MLRSLCLGFFTLLLTFTGLAHAAPVNFNGGAVSNCPRSGTTYNCSAAFIGANDTAIIASGYTVVVNGPIDFVWAQGLQMSGTARLETTGSNGINLSKARPSNISVSGGTIRAGDFVRDTDNKLRGGGEFRIAEGQSVTASVLANAVVTSGSSATIKGNITAVSVTLGSVATVTGDIFSNSLSTGNNTVIKGEIVVSGAVALGSAATVTGNISGGTITTVSSTNITGTVTATTAFTLESGSNVNGDITAPTVRLLSAGSKVKGNISASNAITIQSGVEVNGNIDGGALTLEAGNAVVNGNVNMSGNVILKASAVINGDLKAHDVRTEASNAKITGNAAVNSLYLGYAGSVGKVVTCTGPGGRDCNCVTRENQWDFTSQHTCGAAAPPAGVDHFQITHSGSALTCRPQTVTVTACANASCSSNYAGDTSVTLQPGGKTFNFKGQTNIATVEQTTAATVSLSASGASTGPPTCFNTGNNTASCAMKFEDAGLQVSVNNHIAMTKAKVTIEALKASASKQSCVPLGPSLDIDLSCAFVDPKPGTARAGANVNIAGKALSCGGSAVKVPFTFDSDGLAWADLSYPEVGEVRLNAKYSGAAVSASIENSDNFIAAPAKFAIAATGSLGKIKPGDDVTATSAAFAKAGEEFTVTISAVNDKGEVTTNFGLENPPHSFSVSSTVTNPSDTTKLGTIKINQGTPSSQFNFDDVGIITVNAALLGRDGIYLGQTAQGEAFKTKGEQKIGRIVPAYFKTSIPDRKTAALSTGLSMPCRAGNSSNLLVSPCTDGFIYSGQPFHVMATAFNAQGKITENHQGSLTRSIDLLAMAANGDTTATANGSITGTALPFSFVKGVGITNANSLPVFNFVTVPSATGGTNPTEFYLNAVDKDGVSSRRSIAKDSVEQALTAVSGRLLMPNVYGSPTSSMRVTVQAQFYDSTRGGFLFNPVYNAPANTPPDITLKEAISYSNCQKALAAPGTNNCIAAANLQLLAPDNPAFSLGKASFRLQAPTPRQNGAGAVTITLRSSSKGEWIKYLPSTSGNATFGIYRSGPVIYTREVY